MSTISPVIRNKIPPSVDESPIKGADSLKNLKSRLKPAKTTKNDEDDEDEDAGAEISPTKVMTKDKNKIKRPKAKEFTGGLSQDFQSFDILWFDLSTKTRALVGELTQPIIDKVYSHKDLL